MSDDIQNATKETKLKFTQFSVLLYSGLRYSRSACLDEADLIFPKALTIQEPKTFDILFNFHRNAFRGQHGDWRGLTQALTAKWNANRSVSVPNANIAQ